MCAPHQITLKSGRGHRPGVSFGMRRTILTALLLPTTLAAQAPADFLGAWTDDYGSTHEVSDSLWVQHGTQRYEIVRWDSAGAFAIARNAASNKSDGGRFTRIDWLRLEGMAPYTWAFCLTTWDAPTADSALRTPPARRGSPRTGCGGFPFTRLRKASAAGG